MTSSGTWNVVRGMFIKLLSGLSKMPADDCSLGLETMKMYLTGTEKNACLESLKCPLLSFCYSSWFFMLSNAFTLLHPLISLVSFCAPLKHSLGWQLEAEPDASFNLISHSIIWNMTKHVLLWPSECWEINMLIFLHLLKSSLRESKHLLPREAHWGNLWYQMLPQVLVLSRPTPLYEWVVFKVYLYMHHLELWIRVFLLLKNVAPGY